MIRSDHPNLQICMKRRIRYGVKNGANKLFRRCDLRLKVGSIATAGVEAVPVLATTTVEVEVELK